jgi:neutral ceramidase
MKCGFYEADITPPLGSIIPGGFGARYSTDVLEKIYARAFYCEDKGKSAAIVVIDACGITLDITRRIRKRVCSFIPMSENEIMVIATHTHTGGPTLNWGEEVVTDPFYLDLLVSRAADAIICAYNRAQSAQLLVGHESLTGVSFIRIYRMKDGGLKTNPGIKNREQVLEPFGEIDPDVGVLLAVCDDRPIGAIVNFACHPAINSGTKTSADFIGVLSDEMKVQFGNEFVTLFINGACGNINHINVFDEETFKPDRQVVVGREIAKKVISAIGSSVPAGEEILQIDKTIQVRLRKPAAEDLLKAKNHFDSLGDSLPQSTPQKPGYVETFFALQAFQIAADKRVERDVYLQLIKIGDVCIVGNPCQMFVEFGRKVKQQLGQHVFFSDFANDYCGYVPTPECMVPGVYEARLAPTSGLERAAGDIICDALIQMYNEM